MNSSSYIHTHIRTNSEPHRYIYVQKYNLWREEVPDRRNTEAKRMKNVEFRDLRGADGEPIEQKWGKETELGFRI